MNNNATLTELETKQCSKCNEVKPLSEFNKHSQSKDGRQAYCRNCQKKYGATFYRDYNSTPIRRAEQAIYFARHKLRKAEAKLGVEILDTLKPYEMAMIQSADECIYCGKDLEPGAVTVDHVRTFEQNGANDYRNLLPCCKSCNSSKRDKSIYDFLTEYCDEYQTKQVIFTLAQRQGITYDEMERLLKEGAEKEKQHELLQ